MEEKVLNGLWALVATAQVVRFHIDAMQESTKSAMSR